jgi:hypothetical protein
MNKEGISVLAKVLHILTLFDISSAHIRNILVIFRGGSGVSGKLVEITGPDGEGDIKIRR